MRRVYGIVAMLVLLAACSDAGEERSAPVLETGLRMLGGEGGDGFAHATEPRAFVFPGDHGSHPEYRTEWWYFTGNLATPAGRHFGFELTFFRYALEPAGSAREGESAWRAEQVWMAHFAITERQGGRFIARERLTREALGLAGAVADPLRIWVKDWGASGEVAARKRSGCGSRRVTMRSRSTCSSHRRYRPSRKAIAGSTPREPANGNASHYYSVPRLAAEGRVTVEGETFAVTGLGLAGSRVEHELARAGDRGLGLVRAASIRR